jgi:pseudo-response regulator 7
VSGSNNDSYGHVGHHNAMAAGSNGESLNGGNSASGGGNGVGNIGNPNQGFDGASGASSLENRFAIREAALHKFRQKRKDRCFEKKVVKSFLVTQNTIVRF